MGASDDGVKEVFVTELAPIMWWFFTVRSDRAYFGSGRSTY